MKEIKVVLQDLKQDNKIYLTKDSRYDATAIDKLEAYEVIRPKTKHSFGLTEKGYKHLAHLLIWNSTLEAYPFENPSASNTINISHSNISQLNHQSHHNTLDQITNPVVRETLSETFSEKQLEEIQQFIKENSSPAEKKSLIKKILSYGPDVGTKFLINLLTNPALYT